jgi:hypothetical protein
MALQNAINNLIQSASLFLTSGSFKATISSATLTADREISTPDKDGTIALLSDIGSGGGSSTPSIIPVSASKTLALTDAGSVQACNSASPVSITVPLDSAVNFSVGTEIHIIQDNAGLITIDQSTSGVNIRRSGSEFVTGHAILGLYSRHLLQKVAANEWRLYRLNPMTFQRTYFDTLFPNATVAVSSTSVGSEVDILGDNLSSGTITLYATIAATVAGSIDIKANYRDTGAAFSKASFDYNLPVAVGTTRVPIGVLKASRRMNVEVRNNIATGSTQVTISAELEKLS